MAIAVVPCRKDLRTFAREGSRHNGAAIHLRQNTAHIFTGRGGDWRGRLERQASAEEFNRFSSKSTNMQLLPVRYLFLPHDLCTDSPNDLLNSQYDRSAASSGFEPEGDVRCLWLPLSWSVSNIHRLQALLS